MYDGTTKYCDVLRKYYAQYYGSTTRSTTQYYAVLRSTTKYYEVLQSTTKQKVRTAVEARGEALRLLAEVGDKV